MTHRVTIEDADEHGFFIDRKVRLDGLKVGTITAKHLLFVKPPYYVATSPHGVESPPYSQKRFAAAWLIGPLVDGDPYDIIGA